MPEFSTPSINLLSSHAAEKKRHKAKDRRIQSLSVLMLIGYLAVLGTLVISRFVISSRLNKIEADINNEKLTIAQYKQVENLHSNVKNKAEIIAGLIKVKPLRQQFSEIRAFLPERVILESIALGEQENSVDVAMIAEDLFALIPLLDQVEKEVDSNAYSQVFLDTISRDEDGTYHIKGQFNNS